MESTTVCMVRSKDGNQIDKNIPRKESVINIYNINIIF